MPIPRQTLTELDSGAGEDIRVGLQNLFNDSSEEAKLLAYQLSLLNNHLNSNKGITRS